MQQHQSTRPEHDISVHCTGSIPCAQDHLFVNEGLDTFNEYGCVQAVLGQQGLMFLMLRAMTPLGQQLGVHEGVLGLAVC